MPERNLVSLEEVSLTFGGKPLFENIRLHIAEGDKLCLVGRNGAGKTTLMRLIAGELEPDAGERRAMPGICISTLAQQFDFNREETVLSFVSGGLSAEKEHAVYLAEDAANSLALRPGAALGTLSGGQLRRAALARALVAKPDLLLLDEPTNHLDLTAIEWLENTLKAYGGAYLCVSHDRTFLSHISRKTLWIDRGNLRVCPKGYAHFDAWADALLEQEAREIRNMQKKMEAEIDWTQGGVSGRRKRNQRRLNELTRLRAQLKTDKAAYLQSLRKISADPLTPTPASKVVAEFKSVSKSFTREGHAIPVMKDFDYAILRCDRIGILGKNGSGKSTFLKLLTGEIAPDAGRVFRGKNTEIAYFDQHRSELNPKKTLWQTLCPNGGDYVFLGYGEEKKPKHVCGYLKDFLFDPKIARDPVSTLSGGQANRLMLAKVLSNPGNVLILDEPTNDLDMDTLDRLQEILSDYRGTLILVSHDRDFLDKTVTEILAFEGDGVITAHSGGYTDYLVFKRQQEGKETLKSAAPTARESAPKAATGAPPRTRMSFKLVHELEKLPSKIEALEQEIAQLRITLADADLYTRDAEAFDAAAARLSKALAELEASELRWLELENLRDGAA